MAYSFRIRFKSVLFFILIFTYLSCSKNQPPKCKILSPLNNTLVRSNDTVNIHIEANDPDGTIITVNVYLDNIEIKSFTEKPFELEFPTIDMPFGEKTLKATASDDSDAKTSDEVSFELGDVPLIQTREAIQIGTSSAILGGDILSNEESIRTGIYLYCYVSEEYQGKQIEIQPSYKSFYENIKGLTPGTKYDVIAYGSNKFGIGYGQEISFTTVPVSVPVVTTIPPNRISYDFAFSGGIVNSTGNLSLTMEGICWGTGPNLSINDETITVEPVYEVFPICLKNLTSETTYYVRAYAKNDIGIGYGAEFSFTTLTCQVPTLSTQVNNVTYTSASCTGSISHNGGKEVTERGICWSTKPDPGISDNYILDEEAGIGTYTIVVSELTPGEEYYVRAFAKNEVGIGYGEEVSITTPPYVIPKLTTELVEFTTTSALFSGSISHDGGQEVTERGICWSTRPDPGTFDNYILDVETGIGTYTLEITDLTPGAEYHVRAFAKNSIGISYGNEITFHTLGPPTVKTFEPYSTSDTEARFGGIIEYDPDTNITENGIFYGEHPNPVATGTRIQTDPERKAFSYEAGGLVIGNTYYVVAFASNSYGMGYGEEIQYTHVEADDIISDLDGNEYRIVEIGSQIWMADNLATTHYNDGTPIPNVTDSFFWEDIDSDAYCWCHNDREGYGKLYGALYNIEAVLTNNLCPSGWHVPSDDEWKTLEGTIGMSSSEQDKLDLRGTNEGGKLKETGTVHWQSPNVGATNEYGFNALPGGFRHTNGIFFWVYHNTHWWTSTQHPTSEYFNRYLDSGHALIGRGTSDKRSGFYIRCVKE